MVIVAVVAIITPFLKRIGKWILNWWDERQKDEIEYGDVSVVTFDPYEDQRRNLFGSNQNRKRRRR